MRLSLSDANRPNSIHTVDVSVRWDSEINLLIYTHALFFLAYHVISMIGVMPVGEETFTDFVQRSIALPGPARLSVYWLFNVFTYQFVHISLFEFAFSMGVLWFFGHLLSGLIGQRQVIVVYLISVTIAAIAFLGSHIVFRIFSGYGTILEGAFAGAFGVMAATVVFLRPYNLRMASNFRVSFLSLTVIILLISLIVIFKYSMAYVFVYAASIYVGARYASAYRIKIQKQFSTEKSFTRSSIDNSQED